MLSYSRLTEAFAPAAQGGRGREGARHKRLAANLVHLPDKPAGVLLALCLAAILGCAADATTPPPAPSRVELALAKPLSLEVKDERLDALLQRLAQQSGIDIQPHVFGTARVRVDVANMPLAELLDAVLHAHGLTWEATAKGVEVMSGYRADFVTKVYQVGDLLDQASSEAGERFDEAMLVQAIAAIGGGAEHIEVLPGALVIANTPELHSLIEQLLAVCRDTESARERFENSRVRRALAARAVLDHSRPLLEQIVQELHFRHGVNVVWRLSDEVEARPASVLQDDSLDVRLESALNMACDESAYEWCVHDECLILARSGSARLVETRVFPMSHDQALDREDSASSIANGGSAWMRVNRPDAFRLVPGGLVGEHNERIHAQVARLLANCQAALDPRQPAPLDRLRSPDEQRIEECLDKTVSIAWSDEPLLAAVARLARRAGVRNVFFDMRALEEAGVDQLTTVRRTHPGLTLRSALYLALEPHGLSWLVRDETLYFTNTQVVGDYVEARAYRVPDLLGDPLSPEHESLLTLIARNRKPQDWPPSEFPGGVVLSTDQHTHRLIRRFLHDLSMIAANKGESPRITTLQSSEAGIQTHYYPLPQIVDGLAEGIASSVAREDWVEQGGLGSLSVFADGLVISQTARNHAQIERVLAELSPFLSSQGAAATGVERHFDSFPFDGGPATQESIQARVYDVRWFSELPWAWWTTQAELNEFICEAAPRGKPRNVVLSGALVSSHDGPGHARLRRLFEGRAALERRLNALDAEQDFATWLDDDQPLVRSWALHALARLTPDASAVPALLTVLDRGDADERIMALRVLGIMGSDAVRAVPALAALLDENDPEVVQATIAALINLGESAEPALPALAPLISDPEHREQALAALVSIGPPSVETLVAHLKGRTRDTLPAATDVCVALGKIAAWPDVAVPALRAMLSDKELLHWPMRRAAVAAALSDFGPAARAAIPDLKSALQDDALSVQQAAAAALAQIEEGEAPP